MVNHVLAASVMEALLDLFSWGTSSRWDSYYGYGWVVSPTDEGRIVWHDGGNGWSLGVMARFPDQDAMVFWVSNHAYKDGEWNLEKLEQKLTLGIAERVLDED